jgi:secondary thiamine-phosphate synthase enzyme
MIKRIDVRTSSRTEFVDITSDIRQAVRESGVDEGCCSVYVPHTTAGITLNENADPSVKEDILRTLERLIPLSGNYRHLEGNSDAHIKSSLVGSSVQVIIDRGDIVLGQWQGIFFCEFDGPRSRKAYIQVTSG